MIWLGLLVALILNDSQLRNPLKKGFFQKMWFFGDLGFPSVVLVNKPLKGLCLSSKMVYQHLLYLLSFWTYWHLKFTQGPTHLLNAKFKGCWIADFTSGLQCAETAVWWWDLLLISYITLIKRNIAGPITWSMLNGNQIEKAAILKTQGLSRQDTCQTWHAARA